MPLATDPTLDDASPDSSDRVADFLARHGGAGAKPPVETERGGGSMGRSEVYAADGYTLRCDWSNFGSRKEMTFSEIPPE